MPERNAWCKLDKFGDLEDVVKIIELEGLPNNDTGTIITMNKMVLGEYASVCDFTLMRMFDITRYKSGSFSGWDNRNEPIIFDGGRGIWGSLVVADSYGSYSRGFQIHDIGVPKEKIINGMWYRPSSEEPKPLCVRVVVASIELKKLQFDRAIERSDDHRIFTRI